MCGVRARSVESLRSVGSGTAEGVGKISSLLDGVFEDVGCV